MTGLQRGGVPVANDPSLQTHLLGGVPVVPGGHGTNGGGQASGVPLAS